VRLSPVQKRHLREMVDKPFWYPVGSGEHSSAEALVRAGLVKRQYGVGHAVYEITPEGEKVGRALVRAEASPDAAANPSPDEESA